MTENEARRKVYMSDLRFVMKQMIDHIKESGEMYRHNSEVYDKNRKAVLNAHREEKERKRLAHGSEYHSSQDSLEVGELTSEMEDSNWSSGSDEESSDSERSELDDIEEELTIDIE